MAEFYSSARPVGLRPAGRFLSLFGETRLPLVGRGQVEREVYPPPRFEHILFHRSVRLLDFAAGLATWAVLLLISA